MVASLLAPFFLAALPLAPVVPAVTPTPLATGSESIDDAAPPLVVKAERLIVRPGEELTNVTIVIDNGRILSIGTDVEAPAGARTLESKVVCAGFIDPWTTLGLDGSSVAELRSNAATLSSDAINPFDTEPERKEALRGGVTAVRAQAAADAVIGGAGTLLRTHGGDAVHDVACVSMSIGTTRNGRSTDVFARVGEVSRLTTELEKARRYDADQIEYRFALAEWEEETAKSVKKLEKDFKKTKKARDKKKKEAESKDKDKEFKDEKYKEDKKPRAPKFDPSAEMLARVVRGEIPLIVEVHRFPELRALLSATRTFSNMKLVLAGATESTPLANEISSRNIPVICWPGLLGDARDKEWAEHRLDLAANLAKAGVDVMIGSRGMSDVRDLRMLASTAVGHGLDADAALAAITEIPARVFNAKGRFGALRQGAEADLVLLDGNPIDTTARVRYVVSQGRVVVEP